MESYFLEGGFGSIDLVGNEFDCAIYFQGKPYAINWADCEGGVGQLLVRTGLKGFKKDLRQLRHVLENGLDPEQKISDQIYPILQLFKYGDLILRNYCPDQWEIIDYDENQIIDYYPFGEPLVTTQPRSSLNVDTILKYEASIKSGNSPVVVTTSVQDGWCEFVLDGHHKLQAYDRLKKPPNIVNIEKPKSTLSIDKALPMFKNKNSMEIYKKVKVKYG